MGFRIEVRFFSLPLLILFFFLKKNPPGVMGG